MFDLHSHILPEVDDGAKSLAEAEELLRLSVADGVKGIVATPHVNPSEYQYNPAVIEQAELRVRALIASLDLPIALKVAGEVRLSPDIVPMAEQGNLPLLGLYHDKPTILVEFHHVHILPGTEKIAESLIKLGYQLLIAHPERNSSVVKDISILEPFIEMGCLLQINAGSLLGHFRQEPRDRAMQMLKKGWVHVIASDTHNLSKRRPCLRDAYQHVAMLHGEALAEQLCVINPKAIFEGKKRPDDAGREKLL